MRNFLDTAEQKLCAAGARVDRRLLAVVSLAALACMLLAHGFAFANLFPNHDGTVLVFDAQWTMYVLAAQPTWWRTRRSSTSGRKIRGSRRCLRTRRGSTAQ